MEQTHERKNVWQSICKILRLEHCCQCRPNEGWKGKRVWEKIRKSVEKVVSNDKTNFPCQRHWQELLPPGAKTTDAWNHNHQCTAHTGFARKPHFVGKRPGIIIHPARMHHRQTIAHHTAFKHFFAGHWARAAIGKRTRHHAQGVHGAFNAAKHKIRTQRG